MWLLQVARSVGRHWCQPVAAGKLAVLSKRQYLVTQVQAEMRGTDLFATLNTVHVKYRGFFVERFICCGHPLREVCSNA